MNKNHMQLIKRHLSIKIDQSWNKFYYSHVIACTCIYCNNTFYIHPHTPPPPGGIRGLFWGILLFEYLIFQGPPPRPLYTRSAHAPTHCRHTLITSQNINHTNMRERLFFLGQNIKHANIFH